MRSAVGRVLLVGWALGGAGSFAGASTELPARAGERLEVDLYAGGSIRVEGGAPDVVVLAPLFSPTDGEMPFEISRGPQGIRVTSRAAAGVADIGGALLRVPERMHLELSTAGGSIEIEAVEGDARCRTMGGDVLLSRLRGTIDAETLGGTIRLRDSVVDGELTTMGGAISVTGVEGTVDASSGGGNVEYQEVVAGSRDCREVRISTQGGDVRAPESPCGLDVRTLGGNIRVPRAGDHVRAVTSGGNVAIESVDGWVHVMTGGGDIEVRMDGDPARGRKDIRLDSRGGTVTLRFPDGLSAEFDLTLTYARGTSRGWTITGDVPLELRESEVREPHGGRPQRLLTGKGTLAGGKNKIKITTTDGDIRLIRE